MRALVFGIAGQDGSYLAELLLSKHYDVYGVVRRSSSINRQRIEHLRDKIETIYGDISDGSSVNAIIRQVEPHEIYNLAAQSHVGISFEIPEYTANITALGALRILEVIRETGMKTRFYQASSSEMFGNSNTLTQNEETPFNPVSPYGIAKLFAHQTTVNYRKAYGIHASCGILFNHESPRRGENFVTQKIVKFVRECPFTYPSKLHLGNLDAKRDFGYAKDYVKAMWLMLQQTKPDDYVIATGENHSIRDFCKSAFNSVGMNYKDHVVMDKQYLRPIEVNSLCGDYSKAKKKLGWEPTVGLPELIQLMIKGEV